MLYVVYQLHQRGSARATPHDAGLASTLEFGLVVAQAFYLVGRVNQRSAHRLQRQIDELNAMERNP
jgi:hypothetical protein